MKLSLVNRRLSLILILVLAVVNSGCVDLSAIRKFAEISTEAGQQFPQLAKDLNGSCMRRYYYQKIREEQFRPERMPDITNPDPTSPAMSEARERCGKFTEQEKRLIEANAVMVNYLQAMAALAADDLTSFDQSLNGLGNSFTAANVFNEAEVKAVKNLAGLLLTAFTDGYRRKKLKTTIENHNEDVKTLAAALQRIAAQNYILELKNEQGQLRSYYIDSIRDYADYMKRVAAKDGSENKEDSVQNPLPVIQVKRQWDEEELDLRNKITAAESYGKIMQNISEGHQKLFDNRNKLNSKETVQIALKYGKAIQPLVQDFRKAF